DRVLGVRDGLPLRHLANQPLAVFRERDDRGGQSCTFLVDDDRGLAVFHDRDDRIGGAEVDSNHFSWHVLNLPSFEMTHITAYMSACQSLNLEIGRAHV